MLGRERLLATATAVAVIGALAAPGARGAPTPGGQPKPNATPASSTSSASSANSALVGEWHLDELDTNSDGPTTTPDSSGNSDSLRLITPTAVPGRFGNALNFNAANHDYASTFGPQLQPAVITTMAWVKGSSTPGQYKDIVSQGGTSSCALSSYSLYTGGNGGLSFYVATGSTTTVNSPSVDPATIWNGQWHAVAGTFDGSNVRFYVDGTEIGAPMSTGGAPIDYLSDTTFEVGNYDNPCGGDYTGAIDEVRVYNRALSDAEIGEIQSSTATTPPELGADPTTTHVDCMPATVPVGSATSCTATVTDTAAADASAPTGQVAFTSDSPGTFSPAAATCTLGAPVGLTSTCSVSYTATALRTGTHQITGAYTSDATDASSTGTANLTVSSSSAGPSPTPTPPATTRVQATFTAPSSTAPATPFTLDAGATTGASTLLWSLNGKPAASCNAATPNLTVAVAAPTTVTLTAFGPRGSATSSHLIPLLAGFRAPPAAAAPLLGTAVCSGGAPDVDVTANGGPPAGCSTNVIAGIVSAVGCLTQVKDPTQVPGPEQGILNAMLSRYQATPAAQALGAYYCSTTTNCSRKINIKAFPGISRTIPVIITLGLYLSTQPVRINGVDFTPLHGSTIAVSPGMARVVSSDALVRVGGVPIDVGQINLDVSNNCTPACSNSTQLIASFNSQDLPGLSGDDFPFTGMADISFVVHGTDRYSEIHGHIELPASLGGITVDAKLRVDDTNGITPESFKGTAMNLGFDGIGLTNVLVEYDAPDNWMFYGDLGLGPKGYQVRIAPNPPTEPFNGIVFKHGSLDHAGATLDLSAGPPEIAPGVLLDKISLSFSTHPSALRGSVTLNALGVADVTGNLVLAFPSQGEGFTPAPTDLPNAPPDILHQTYMSGPVFGVGGTATVTVPVLGQLPLGGGYLLYDAPGYVAAGGTISTGIKDIFTLTGFVNGEFNVTNHRFNLQGGVHGCAADLCGDVTGVLSSYGAGICAGSFGAGVRWSDFPIPHLYGKFLGIGVGCRATKFTDDHVFDGNDLTTAQAHLLGASTTRTFVVKRGQPVPEIELDGDSGAPNVTVTGPGGQVLTARGLGVHQAGSIIAIQSESLRETVVGVTRATPGTYTITTLAGPTVVGTAHATVPQAASVHGQVTGNTTHRVLHYSVAKQPGERITFSEVHHGVTREIGSSAGGKGSLNFTTSPGPGQRTIIASDSRYDIGVATAQKMFVAHFSGPALVHPGRAGKVSAHWTHGSLTASWLPASNATTYRVTLREKHGALMTMTTRKHSLRIADATAYLPGTVKVVAVSSDGSLGPAVTASYRAAQAAPSRFLPFSALKPKPKAQKGKTKPKKS